MTARPAGTATELQPIDRLEEKVRQLVAMIDTLRAERLPAALIQGQRDYFGAHTYRRTDDDGAFHTDWSGDRTEVRA